MSVISSPTQLKQLKVRRPDKRNWQRLLVWLCSRIGARLQTMPRERAMRWGIRLGDLAYFVAGRQRRYALRNLALTGFPRPEATRRERDALIRRVFHGFGKTVIDFLITPGLPLDAADALVAANGFEHLQAAMARGKGAILITAHMGNWELLGRWLARHGVPLTVVARDPEDPTFGAYVRGLRERNGGVRVAKKGGPVRELLGILKRGEALGLLPDQNSGDLFAPFFSVPAGTVAGPATLTLHTGATLIPTYCVRLPDDRYRLMILPPIDTTSTSDREADVRRIMTDVNAALEGVIRQYPDQWLWIHNRWKSAFETENRERAWPVETEQAAAVRQRWESAKP